MHKSIIVSFSLFISSSGVAQTQAQITQNALLEYKKSDAEMTREWKAISARMKQLDVTAGDRFGYAGALLTSQRAWLKFRDSHCTIVAAEFHRGSMQPMAHYMCLTELTRERRKQLAALRWDN